MTAQSPIALDGQSLSPAAVTAIADGAEVTLSQAAQTAIADGHARLASLIADGTPIYGLTTGFGALDGHAVDPSANEAQQHNLLKSHAAGVGEPMGAADVRAMMAVRANVLATGLTGVRPATVGALVAMLNADLIPYVPVHGSVGACGDLAPLAHMALPLIGLGQARLGDWPWQDGAEALAAAGIAQPRIVQRDGIALINGTEQTTGIGVRALVEGRAALAAGEAVSALTLEALGGLPDAFDERVALWKGHPGQTATSERLRTLLAGSAAVQPPRPSRMRDALSLRCIAQVHGACRDALDHAHDGLAREINAANDNPLFGVADGWVTSNAGNFHGQPAGEVLDYAATSLSSVAVMSERHSARFVDPNHNNGLPAFLIHPEARPGECNGFMLAQYTAANRVAALRMQAIPASLQSVPTCANTEDHVPMAPLAAQRLRSVVDTLWQVLGIELLLAAQAVDLGGLTPAPALAPLYERLRARVPTMITDRVLGPDMAAAIAVLKESADLPALGGEPA